MSEEFPTMPDLSSALAMRIAQKKAVDGPLPPPGTTDPYQLMLKRMAGETAPIDPATIQTWPEEDVKALEDYCKRQGIIGFASRVNPKLALMQLKRQVGDYSGVAMEERCPVGYEKLGIKPTYNPNYPYEEAICKKQIIHG